MRGSTSPSSVPTAIYFGQVRFEPRAAVWQTAWWCVTEAPRSIRPRTNAHAINWARRSAQPPRADLDGSAVHEPSAVEWGLRPVRGYEQWKTGCTPETGLERRQRAGDCGYEGGSVVRHVPTAERGERHVIPCYRASPFTELIHVDYANSSITVPSGAWVFEPDGSVELGARQFHSVANLVDPRIQQTTANVLNAFLTGVAPTITTFARRAGRWEPA